MTVEQLENLTPESYLRPELFVTVWDELPSNGQPRRDEQFRTGKETGDSATTVHINHTSVWSAELKNGGSLTSYERIGYHSCTSALLAGFLASSARIVVGRYNRATGEYTQHEIKAGT